MTPGIQRVVIKYEVVDDQGNVSEHTVADWKRGEGAEIAFSWQRTVESLPDGHETRFLDLGQRVEVTYKYLPRIMPNGKEP